jgi:AraC-like DNA-binding protein
MDDRLLALEMVAWIEKRLKAEALGQDLERELSGRCLAEASGYSENRLRQKFYNVVGETPSGYLRKRRLTEAARALMSGASIADVALSYSYSSQDNFTTAFKSWFGLNPGELRTMDSRYRNFLSRMKEPLNVMELANLKQSRLNTTLMSCVKGASDYFELDWSMPELFGFSGHAFMINIHDDLCPSGPYVWKKDEFFLALRDMGIRRVATISVAKGEGREALAKAEARIRAHLDAGKVCIMDFLEHQLVAGYDPKGLVCLQPWNGESGVELPALSFGDWGEALERMDNIWFTLLDKEDEKAERAGLLSSTLVSALRMRSSPESLAMPGYRVGDGAWESWISGVDRGLGSSHGHWWNGMVWGECRSMAADFFAALEPGSGGAKAAGLCRELSSTYRECAARLDAAKEKEAPPEAQKAALAAGRDLDRRAAGLMKDLLAALVA